MPSREHEPVSLPRTSLVRGVRTTTKRALERVLRAVQGNFDHMDGVIIQVNKKHNALDDNVQELTEFVNDNLQQVATDNEAAIAAHAVDTTSVHDHGSLSGLADDDHPQYTTTAEAQALVDVHTGDAGDAHDASAVSILDTANDFTATDVEGALAELQADAEADATGLSDHIADAADAHAASAITFTPNGSIAATNVQTAIQEVRDEAGGSSTWTDVVLAADYSLTTSQADTALVTGAVTDNDIIEFEVVAYFSGATNGDSLFVGVAGVDAGVTSTPFRASGTAVTAQDSGSYLTTPLVSAGITGAGTTHFSGRVVAAGAGGLIVQTHNSGGARGVLLKGSYLRWKKHTA